MAVERAVVEVPSSYGGTVKNRFFHHDPRVPRLLVLLPGRNYSCDCPALFYLREAALAEGWDVLALQYGFQVAQAELTEDRVSDLAREAELAVGLALERDYRGLCLAGKSLGSALAVKLAASFTGPHASVIALTPLEEAMAGMGKVPTLVVIGTADPLYPSAVRQSDRPQPNVEWRVLAGLDHGLGVADDLEGSLAGVGQVVRACTAFLRQWGGPSI